MIYIIHGENTVSSRNYILARQKERGLEARIELEVTETDPDRLQEACQTFDIFGKAPLVVLDVSNAGRMNLDEYITVLESAPDEAEVFVFSAKKLSNTNVFIKNVSKLKAKALFFKEQPSANIFKFLDGVFDKKRKIAYQELRNLILSGEDPIYLLTMLQYGLRNIAYCKFGSSSYNKIQPFVKKKVQAQAQNFSEQDIVDLFSDLYKLDRNLKTGQVDSHIAIPYFLEKVLQC